jgi:hypothetical protein
MLAHKLRWVLPQKASLTYTFWAIFPAPFAESNPSSEKVRNIT